MPYRRKRKRSYSKRGSGKRWIQVPTTDGSASGAYQLIAGRAPKWPRATPAVRKARSVSKLAKRKANVAQTVINVQRAQNRMTDRNKQDVAFEKIYSGLDAEAASKGLGMYTIHGHGGYISSAVAAGAAGLSAAIPGLSPFIGAGMAAGRAMFGSGDYTSTPVSGGTEYVNSKNINNGIPSMAAGAAAAPIPLGLSMSDRDTGLNVQRGVKMIGKIYAPSGITSRTGSAFSMQEFQLNPGLNETFPWLSEVAKNYKQYSFRQLIFTTVPLLDGITISTGDNPASASGFIDMLYAPDCKARPPKNSDEMHDYGSVNSTIHKPMRLGIECQARGRGGNKLVGPEVRHVRYQGDIDAFTDPNNYDWGKVYVSTHGVPKSLENLAIAELWVTYQCDLTQPDLVSGTGRCIRQDVFAFDDIRAGAAATDSIQHDPILIANAPLWTYTPTQGIAPRVDRFSLVNPGSLWPNTDPEADQRLMQSVGQGIGCRIRCIPQDDVDFFKMLFPVLPMDADPEEYIENSALELVDEHLTHATTSTAFSGPPTRATCPSFRSNMVGYIQSYMSKGAQDGDQVLPYQTPELLELQHYAKLMSFVEVTFPSNFVGDVEFVYEARTDRVCVRPVYRPHGDIANKAFFPPPTDATTGLTEGTGETNWGEAQWVGGDSAISSVVCFRKRGANVDGACDVLSSTRSQQYNTNTGEPLARDNFDEGRINVCSIDGNAVQLPSASEANAPTTINTSLLDHFMITNEVATFSEEGFRIRCRLKVTPASNGIENTVYIGIPLCNPNCQERPYITPEMANPFGGAPVWTSDAPKLDYYNAATNMAFPYGNVFTSAVDPTNADEQVVRAHVPKGIGCLTHGTEVKETEKAQCLQSRVKAATIRIALINDVLDDTKRGVAFQSADGSTMPATTAQVPEPMLALPIADKTGETAAARDRKATISLLTQILANQP